METRFYKILLVVFFSVVFSSVSEAKIKLTPSLTLEEEYTDNLFLEHENEDEDWITTIEPGVAIRIESRWIDLSLDYSFRYEHYAIHDELTDFDFEGGQRADLGTTFFEGRPFTLGVNGTIRRETLDESDNNSDTNELINKSTVYDFMVNPQYRFRLGGQSSLVFGYIYDRTFHDDSRGDDYQGHTGKVSLVKQLSTNAEISLNYSYRINQSDDEEDYDRQTATVGLKQQLGPRTEISLEGGYSIVEYDENDNNDEESVTWSADLNYRLSAPITLSLMFSQDFENSTEDGLVKNRNASFAIDYTRHSVSSSLEVFWEESDYIRIDRNDTSYGANFDLSFPLYSNLSTGFNAGYEKSEYEGIIGKDVDEYSFGASLDYQISRFLTTLDYKHRVNDSDIDPDDYTENTVILRVSVRF